MLPSEPITPRNNLGLYRLRGFVGREETLNRITEWFDSDQHEPLLISGPPGAGKSSLAAAAAWQERGRFPGGIIWVSAAGAEQFRLEDVFFALDAVLDTSIMIKPVRARASAALDVLGAEPRLLILDELEQVENDSLTDIKSLLAGVGKGGKSRAIVIAESVPDDWESDLIGASLVPPPLSADEISALATTDIVSGAARAAVKGSQEELARVTGGNPLLCRLALGLADSGPTGAGVSPVPADLQGSPLEAWLARAERHLRRREPVAARLLARLSLASGGASMDAVVGEFWRGLGQPEELQRVLELLVHLGLVGGDDERVYLHPSVRSYLTGQADPACDEGCIRELEWDLTRHYLELSSGYSTTPLENWAEFDADWPNIRHFANLAIERLSAELGRPISEIESENDVLPAVFPLLRTVEEFALRLLPLILRRHPRAGRRWLTAARHCARLQGHPHRAAQLEAALGGLCYVEEEPECAVRHFTSARAAFEEFGDLRRLMQTELELASVFRALERHDEAIEQYLDSVRLADTYGDDLDRAHAYAQLGAAYLAAGTPFQAIDWLSRAKTSLESEGGPALAALLNNLGLAYEAVGRYRDAIDVYERSFGLIEPSTQASQHQMSTIAGNIGAAFYELGALEDALRWYRRDLALSQAMGDQAATAAVHHNLGHVLLEMGIAQGAIAEFTRAMETYSRLGMGALVAEEQEAIAHAHLAMAREAER